VAFRLAHFITSGKGTAPPAKPGGFSKAKAVPAEFTRAAKPMRKKANGSYVSIGVGLGPLIGIQKGPL
jgi:hypothetical protein